MVTQQNLSAMLDEKYTAVLAEVENSLNPDYLDLDYFNKNNALLAKGIEIKKGGIKFPPVFLKDFETVDDLISHFHRLVEMKNWEVAAPRLRLAVVNGPVNSGRRPQPVFEEVLDLAAVIYLAMPGGIPQQVGDLADEWGKTPEELYEVAYSNTFGKTPMVVGLDHLARILAKRKGVKLPPDLPAAAPVKVLSTFDGTAAVLLNTRLLGNLADEWGDDLFILPSSVAEVLAMPVGIADLEYLYRMVYEVNHTVLEPGEFLSNSVYRFSRETRELSIA